MNCGEVQELLGAYALDALDPEELAEVRGHLATCNLHEEAAELVATASLLHAVPQREAPSPALRAAILQHLDTPGEPAPVSIPPVLLKAPPSRRLALAPYALAAAFAIISLGLLIWNVALLSGGGTDTRVVLMTGTTGSGAVVFDGDDVTVELAGLGSLDASKDYEAWVIKGGVPVPAGVLTVSADGTASHHLASDVPDGAVIAITVEPAGGVDQPTGAAILSAEI